MGTWILSGLVVLASALCLLQPTRSHAFAVWILVAFAAGIVRPDLFLMWGSLNTAGLIVPLIQVIMFGMGTTLTLEDFSRALTQPAPVLIGISAQFLIMPVVGLGLAMAMQLDAQVMAGVILVGSVSGGVASNLMVYLARGNVALSVTMTACSTIASPLMTPLLMKLLCGAIVPISFVEMMLSILNMIIAPIVAGLLANRVLYSHATWAQRRDILCGLVLIALLMTAAAWRLPWFATAGIAAVQPGIIVGAVLVAVALLIRLRANRRHAGTKWMDRLLPQVSMAGIWIIIAIITARSSDTLLAVGITLIVTAVLHNTVGYLLGYWAGRLFRLSETDCRTIAFEVGMQNSGMAAGLAMETLRSAPAALAPAIFGPWMNISGSLLASWWNRRDATQSANPAAPDMPPCPAVEQRE